MPGDGSAMIDGPTPSLRRTLIRYLWFQVPGWILSVVVLWVLNRWFGLPAWLGVLLFTLFVIKDFVLFPLLRRAYEPGVPTALDKLIGAQARVVDTLSTSGYVRLRGELWRAELPLDHEPVAAGGVVTVRATRGLTLLVQAPPDAVRRYQSTVSCSPSSNDTRGS